MRIRIVGAALLALLAALAVACGGDRKLYLLGGQGRTDVWY